MTTGLLVWRDEKPAADQAVLADSILQMIQKQHGLVEISTLDETRYVSALLLCKGRPLPVVSTQLRLEAAVAGLCRHGCKFAQLGL